ncbi:disulfide oxidoreductase [Alkalicoccus halolimnae]|uniref:Probable disulfide formation protein n=1 Tax=Alkalicoccus halolimnae TaxID=1667239 RepID=A0A5C7FHV5_9BACI|nr:disulfide oxidoreductase [Alkalicoccus halolimnae]TXF85864.1 disulfide bond formation protein B [Alkalicoccus halolimnae]
MKNQTETLLASAWTVALTAVLGSLYFSEVQRYVPCELCWVQRIFMYPLVITLAVAVIRKEAAHAYYALPLAIIGGGFSLYHYLLQKVPALQEAGEVCGVVPCNAQYINAAGFITIPFLALTAFTIISILLVLVIRGEKRRNE